ncbi:hypothetical protein [Dongia sp.]|uniref:hypothetical protein n=1 Tax=Dongia sp. TaxID=1977262 RepID=UPI0035B4CF83
MSQAERGFLCVGCRVPVVHVSSFVMNGQDIDLKTQIPARFRLASHQLHQVDCEFTARGQIRLIVDEAIAVEDAANPFDKIGNQYSFRLNVPKEEFKAGAAAEGMAGRLGPVDFKERMERIWSGHRIASYCRSALGLAKIWLFVESSAVRKGCRASVKINVDSQEIDWDDFAFSPTRFDAAFHRLESEAIRHPIVLLVNIRAPSSSQQAKGLLPCVPSKAARSGNDARISPTLAVAQNLLGDFRVGGWYLVVGDWYAKKGKTHFEGPNGPIEYRNIQVNVRQRAQFIEVNLGQAFNGEQDAA